MSFVSLIAIIEEKRDAQMWNSAEIPFRLTLIEQQFCDNKTMGRIARLITS